MKISFWGSSNFSLEILKALYQKHLERKLELVYVVSQPPKPAGRKKELQQNIVAQFCIENHIPLFTPDKVKDLSALITHDSELLTDISVVAAYGKIISESTLNTAKYGFINFHGSILPKYRGATPVQMTVLNQDEVGGITVIKMDKGMDTGDVITNYELLITRNITSGELMKELALASVRLIDDEFDLIFRPERWNLQKQDESKASYCYVSDFTKEKMEVRYEDGVKLAHGKVMAANPEPGAWAQRAKSKEQRTKFNLVRSFFEGDRNSDKFTKDSYLSFHVDKTTKKLYLELSDGFLEILEIQPEGKKVMDARSFINGYRQLAIGN